MYPYHTSYVERLSNARNFRHEADHLLIVACLAAAELLSPLRPAILERFLKYYATIKRLIHKSWACRRGRKSRAGKKGWMGQKRCMGRRITKGADVAFVDGWRQEHEGTAEVERVCRVTRHAQEGRQGDEGNGWRASRVTWHEGRWCIRALTWTARDSKGRK